MQILITVGILARNEEKNIAITLKSLLKQTFNSNEFEIIVIDGNSTDRTREIAKNVLKDSDVEHKILNEADFDFHGLCFARNLVIDNSDENSRYIAFTDADCTLDEKWLSALYYAIKKSSEDVAGAGGPRLIAGTDDKKELVINALITSFLASGGNPAFSKRDIEFLESIPNYNAIYKKDVLSRFRYDDELIVSDDNELNFRLRKAGYSFLYVPAVKVWHSETNSILEFTRNMFSYGVNISNTVRKHKSMVKIIVPLTVIFILYLILLIPLYLTRGWLVLAPLFLYILFALAVFMEVALKTKTIFSLMIFLLLPLQHISYGLGIIYNLAIRRHP